MARRAISDIRRGELVDAALELIHEEGLMNMSVSKVSARAGLATGMVHHYFADKSALLEATMRRLNKRITAQIVGRMRAAQTPIERVHAFIDGNVSEDSFTAAHVAAWLEFWAQVPRHTQLRRIHDVVARRTRTNLAHALKQIIAAEHADYIARALTIFVDGIWLRAAVDPQGVTPAEGRQLAYRFLADSLAAATPKPARRDAK